MLEDRRNSWRNRGGGRNDLRWDSYVVGYWALVEARRREWLTTGLRTGTVADANSDSRISAVPHLVGNLRRRGVK